MNQKTKLVYAGYLKLTEQEKRDLIEEINKHNRKSLSEQLVEKSGIVLGPLSDSCPCCGR